MRKFSHPEALSVAESSGKIYCLFMTIRPERISLPEGPEKNGTGLMTKVFDKLSDFKIFSLKTFFRRWRREGDEFESRDSA